MNQELHLLPDARSVGPTELGATRPPLRNGPGPTQLPTEWLTPPSTVIRDPALTTGTVVEPFLNAANQLRLLAIFTKASAAQVNGEPAPRRFVLAPGDHVQWQPGRGFRVALFNKPQIGPPPASALAKPCPNCRVPFAADATCLICTCGTVLHCEPEEQGLQCAQMRRECPACKRRLSLTEGYVNPPSNED